MRSTDWSHVLVPEVPVLEIFVRGTLVYLGLLVLLRVFLRRQSGGLGVTDVLVVVLIADAASNGMADDYRTVPDGLLLVGVILFWAWVLDWLGFRFPFVQRFVKPPSLHLVAHGRPLWRNMAREFVTMDELMTAVREQGLEDLSGVEHAYMEGDGRISVIPKRHAPEPTRHD